MTAEYVADLEPLSPGVAERACGLLVDRFAPRSTMVWVDAFSDAADLPPAAQAAQAALRERSATGMGIELDPHDQADLRLLRDFAYWSIHVELMAGPTVVATVHDSGHSISFVGDDEDVEALQALGVGVTELVPRRRWWRPQSSWSRPSG